MAQKTIYSGREFSVYVNNDKAGAYAGTFNDATDATWKRLDVDSVTFPSFAPIQEMEMRTGSGRVAQFDEVFTTNKRVLTEFTLSGRLDTTSLPILVEAATGTASASDKVTIGTGYAPVAVGRGDTIVAGDYHLPLSFYFAAPGGASVADSYQLKGCICTSLTLSADMGTASGRFQFDAAFQTQDSITKGAVSTASMASIDAVKLFMADLSTKTIDLAGSATTVELDALWTSVGFTIEQPTQFLGADTNADCEVWARGVPETTFTMSGSVKYDGDTDQIIENYRAANAENAIAIHMANTAEAGAGSFNVAATGIGFDIDKGKLQSAEVSADDIAMVNFEVKALDAGSGNICAILIA
tara:strand:- start:1173 stop:2240 length:1068 start_codon:yes stop_codon:yes gene_type:complete